MSRKIKILVWLLALILMAVSWSGLRLYQELNKRWSENPLVWEADIAALELATQKLSPPKNAIVFVGSSSIRFWDNLVTDMAPLPIIQQGFGGAKLNDLVHYADRIINAYKPIAVVVFAGSNDITHGDTKTPEKLLSTYKKLVTKIRLDRPSLPIYYIAITPSPRRWEMWPQVQATNAVLKDYSLRTPGLFFIDTESAMLGSDGKINKDNYSFDTLHLSEQGYSQWTDIIRPILLNDFPQF